MVLSNKKLKQKLRAELSQSLASSQSSVFGSFSSANPQSLKHLLGEATQKPRLSKREKRRKSSSLEAATTIEFKSHDDTISGQENPKLDSAGGGSEEIGDEKRKKKMINGKKRKRGADVVVVESDSKLQEEHKPKLSDEKKKKKKEKKKANKKKKKKGQKKKVEENDELGAETEVVTGANGHQGVAEKVDNCNSQRSGVVSNKVYVGGIPYYSTEDDIRSFFYQCGTITDMDCMTFPESGKFRGIAILTFKTEEAAKRAIALDGADMGGLFLKIQPYKTTRSATIAPGFSPPMIQGYNKIYVGNLSWDITEDHLRKLFSDCSISSIRFGEDKVTGEFKGYAHVDFSDNLSLAKALKLDQCIVLGRPVRISCAVAKNGSGGNGKSEPTPEQPVFSSKNGDGKDGKNNNIHTNGNTGGVSSGKMRRRTCYDCGERGHISSACPMKQADGQPNESTG